MTMITEMDAAQEDPIPPQTGVKQRAIPKEPQEWHFPQAATLERENALKRGWGKGWGGKETNGFSP